MLAGRDERLRVDSAARRRARADIATPPIDAHADAWQRGPAFQIAAPPRSAKKP